MALHDYGYLPPEFLRSYPVKLVLEKERQISQNQWQGGHIFEKLNSLSFPEISRAFSTFSLRNSREKTSLEYFVIGKYVIYFTFSLSFPGFFYKSSNFPEFSLRF